MPKLYPLEEKTIEASILPTLELAKKKLSKPMPFEELRKFIEKRLQKNEAKTAVNAEIDRLSDISRNEKEIPGGVINLATAEQLEPVIESFKSQLAELKSFKEKYPNIKGFKPLPVNIMVERSRMGHSGSVFALYPTEEFLMNAAVLQPGARAAYDRFIKNKGHHSGALGYARFSMSNGKIVIDNLQTDIDAQGFSDDDLQKNPALKWWVNSIKKFWAPYLLDALNKLGRQIEREVYLTTFEMQQKKWNRIPERNVDIYNRIPDMMGFPEEDVKVKPEDLKLNEWTMRRVATSLDIGATAYYNLCRE
jgi:hypothetical protein